MWLTLSDVFTAPSICVNKTNRFSFMKTDAFSDAAEILVSGVFSLVSSVASRVGALSRVESEASELPLSGKHSRDLTALLTGSDINFGAKIQKLVRGSSSNG